MARDSLLLLHSQQLTSPSPATNLQFHIAMTMTITNKNLSLASTLINGGGVEDKGNNFFYYVRSLSLSLFICWQSMHVNCSFISRLQWLYFVGLTKTKTFVFIIKVAIGDETTGTNVPNFVRMQLHVKVVLEDRQFQGFLENTLVKATSRERLETPHMFASYTRNVNDLLMFVLFA